MSEMQEKVIQRILEKHPELTREDIERLIKSKINEMGGLLTRESATYVVASELKVDLPDIPVADTTVTIKSLISGIDDVSITGRVLSVYPVKKFLRSDGTVGNMAKIVIADKTGALNVVLWDEKTKVIEQERLKVGDIVRIVHGYSREGISGKPELHVGHRSDIIVNPSDVNIGEYPKIEDFSRTISQLTGEESNISLVGAVIKVFPTIEFKDLHGRIKQVKRVRLVDNTGSIIAVFWNTKAEDVKDLGVGDILRIVGGKVKRGKGELELHVDEGANVEILDRERESTFPFLKIKFLKDGMTDVDILGRVSYVGPIRSVKRANGTSYNSANLLLKDDTGMVELVLWGDHANLASFITRGDIILARGCYTRHRMGLISLYLGKHGSIEVVHELSQATILPPVEEKTSICNLKEGWVEAVEGVVATKPVRSEILVENKALKALSFYLRDESGRVEVNLLGKLTDAVDIAVGTKLVIRNALVKKKNDRLVIFSTKLTSIDYVT